MNSIYKINVEVKDESDLYNSFDKFNQTISEDAILYIINKSKFAGITDDIEICLNSKNKIDKECFSKAYHKYISEQLELERRESRINTTKQIWLFCVGILFIGLSLFFSNKANVIVLEIISTIGSFSIWESANSWLLERKAINLRILKLIRLKNCTIE